MVVGSLRRSILQPTNKKGTLGQKWRTSGTHCVEKDKGRRRKQAAAMRRWKARCLRLVAARLLVSPRHLLGDVLQRVGAVDGEADEEDVRVGVGERAEAVVVLLSSGIPQRQLNGLAVNLNVRNIVLKHGGHVHLQSEGEVGAMGVGCGRVAGSDARRRS